MTTQMSIQTPAPADADAGAGPARRRRPAAWLVISLTVLTGLIVVSIFAPLIAPDNPTAQDLTHRLAGPSAAHWLGTDSYGRDVLSRLIYGGRPAFLGVLITMGVALVLGIPWGLAAGYWPRVAGVLLMRAADAFLAFPALVLAIAITGVLGPNLVSSMVSVGIVFAPFIARLMRSGVLEARQRDYVTSARLSGLRDPLIIVRHILPTAIGSVVVQATVLTGLGFIIEGALSFLGLGVQAPTPSWGGDLYDAYQVILGSPGQVVAPGLVIAVVVLCVYRVGDAVRDALVLTGRTDVIEQEPILSA